MASRKVSDALDYALELIMSFRAMAGESPRLLVDRDITVIRDNRPQPTRLRAWLDGYAGPMPSYRVELATRLTRRQRSSPRDKQERGGRLPRSVDVSAVVDAHDVGGPGGLIDPVDHAVGAAPRGMVPG
jgi:hypothetical protein